MKATLQLALEALEHSHANEPIWKTPHREAITAIKEALAQPEKELFQCEVKARPLAHPLSAYHMAMSEGPLNYTWTDKPHRLVYDLIAAVKYYAQPEQRSVSEHLEPVAWSDKHLQFLNFLYGAGEFDGVWFEQKHQTEKGAFWWRKHLRRLFDAPPQRTWVGLTDEEIKSMDAGIASNSSFYAGALWANSKLKEKNK